MTFGRFTNKWHLFCRPLEVKLENIGPLFMSATQIHNFCINEKLLEDGGVGNMVACMADGQLIDELHYIPSSVEVHPIRGNSMMRDFLVNKVRTNSL